MKDNYDFSKGKIIGPIAPKGTKLLRKRENKTKEWFIAICFALVVCGLSFSGAGALSGDRHLLILGPLMVVVGLVASIPVVVWTIMDDILKGD